MSVANCWQEEAKEVSYALAFAVLGLVPLLGHPGRAEPRCCLHSSARAPAARLGLSASLIALNTLHGFVLQNHLARSE